MSDLVGDLILVGTGLVTAKGVELGGARAEGTDELSDQRLNLGLGGRVRVGETVYWIGQYLTQNECVSATVPIWGKMLPVLDCKLLTMANTLLTSWRFSATGAGEATAQMALRAKKETTMDLKYMLLYVSQLTLTRILSGLSN